MLFTKGQACKLAGIKTETLRHYVERSLVVPTEVGENGYNLYAMGEVVMAIAVRELRSYGVSLESIEERAQDPSWSPRRELLESQLESMRTQKRLLEQRITNMEQHLDGLKKYGTSGDRITVSQGFDYVAAFFDNTSSSAEAVRTLQDRLPYSMGVIKVPRPGEDVTPRVGYMLPADLFKTMVSATTESYEYYNGLRIDTTLNMPNVDLMRWEDFSLITGYAAAHNYTPTSDVLCLVNYAYRNDDGSVGALIFAGVYVE